MPVAIFEFLDVRAFSSLWYWLLLGLVWTRIMQSPLGVPVDLLRAAQRSGGQALSDVETLAGIEARYRLAAIRAAGIWRTVGWYFALGALAALSLVYALEPAQAILVIAAPIGLVRWLAGRAAQRLHAHGSDAAASLSILARLRWQVQAVGLAAVFVAAVYGMAHSILLGGVPL